MSSCGCALTVSYDSALREQIRAVFGGVGAVDEAGRALTVAHAEAVERLLEESGLGADDVDVIGFHGQTILHRPAERRTWQIGDGDLLGRDDRHRRGRRFPQPRHRARRPGRASGAAVPRRALPELSSGRSPCSTSAASPT